MLTRIKKFFGIKEADLTPQQQLLAALNTGHCPDCGGKEFYSGPSGGLSHDILCANPACLHEFCYASGFFADRVSRTEADRKAVYGV